MGLGKESYRTINFYTGLVTTVIPLIISIASEDLTFPSNVENILYVVSQSVAWGIAGIVTVLAVSMTTPLLVTFGMSLQVVFLLIGQYTVLSDIQPGVGNWVEITGLFNILYIVTT